MKAPPLSIGQLRKRSYGLLHRAHDLDLMAGRGQLPADAAQHLKNAADSIEKAVRAIDAHVGDGT